MNPLTNSKEVRGDARVRRLASMRSLTLTSAAESICDRAHDPIFEPRDVTEYALSFVSAMLSYADPHSCFLMIEGLRDSLCFPETDGEESDELPEDEVKVTRAPAHFECRAKNEQSMEEAEGSSLLDLLEARVRSHAQWKANSRKEREDLADKVTWLSLLHLMGPEVLLDRLREYDVEVQITEHDGFRAAAKTEGMVFDIGGKSKAEAIVKLMILLELYLREPLFTWSK